MENDQPPFLPASPHLAHCGTRANSSAPLGDRQQASRLRRVAVRVDGACRCERRRRNPGDRIGLSVRASEVSGRGI